MKFLCQLAIFIVYPILASALLLIVALSLLMFWPLILHPKAKFTWDLHTKKGLVRIPDLHWMP
jgi:hypothetical protein